MAKPALTPILQAGDAIHAVQSLLGKHVSAIMIYTPVLTKSGVPPALPGRQ